MRVALPILAAVALLVGVDAPLAAKPMGSNLTFAAPPPVPLATPNLGAPRLPSQSIGAPDRQSGCTWPHRSWGCGPADLRRAAWRPRFGHVRSERGASFVG